MSQQSKLPELDYQGLVERRTVFYEERKALSSKLLNPNGSSIKKTKRKKRYDDLDQRLIPLVEQYINLKAREQMPSTALTD